jgi:hypothetical protein
MPGHLLEHRLCHAWNGGMIRQGGKQYFNIAGALSRNYTELRSVFAQGVDGLGPLAD